MVYGPRGGVMLRTRAQRSLRKPYRSISPHALRTSRRRHAENESTTKSTKAVPKHLAACLSTFAARFFGLIFVLSSCSLSQNDAAGWHDCVRALAEKGWWRRHAENESTTKSTKAVPKHLAACLSTFAARFFGLIFVLSSCSLSQNDAAGNGQSPRDSSG